MSISDILAISKPLIRYKITYVSLIFPTYFARHSGDIRKLCKENKVPLGKTRFDITINPSPVAWERNLEFPNLFLHLSTWLLVLRLWFEWKMSTTGASILTLSSQFMILFKEVLEPWRGEDCLEEGHHWWDGPSKLITSSTFNSFPALLVKLRCEVSAPCSCYQVWCLLPCHFAIVDSFPSGTINQNKCFHF